MNTTEALLTFLPDILMYNLHAVKWLTEFMLIIFLKYEGNIISLDEPTMKESMFFLFKKRISSEV